MLRFTKESLFEVLQALQKAICTVPPGESSIVFEVLHPDLSSTHFSGEYVEIEGQSYIYRSLKTWMELAEQLRCRMWTPEPTESEHFVRLRWTPQDESASWHTQSAPSGHAEKYGTESGFFRLNKLEEPSFLMEYLESIRAIPLPPNARILNAGVNKGDEFEIFLQLFSPEEIEQMTFVGIDHSASAIEHARKRFPSTSFEWMAADLNDIEALELEPFDLIISIGTLHSSSLRSHEVFSTLVRKTLKPNGHMILGFPNCRYIDHEVRYGAKMKNYSRPELSVMWKEVAYHKRYLQQHHFRVTLTGKHTLFLTAVRLPHKGSRRISKKAAQNDAS